MKIELGKTNKLSVLRFTPQGAYLDGGPDNGILLPKRYVAESLHEGDEIEVFVYLDSEERLVATTEQPKAQVGDFAWLRVAWVNKYGAFLDWGLMKDLFVPFREQRQPMEQGRYYLVHVHIDPESYRIVASSRIEMYLNRERPPYQAGQEVQILVAGRTPLGYKAIIENAYQGLLFADAMFTEIHSGDRLTAYIKQVRPDGKIDLSLQQTGQQGVINFAERLLQHIEMHGGTTHLCDNSPADEIYAVFGVSKKAFKRAVGDLYKRRLITIEPTGLRLVK
ncbi:MAG: GntR family transcriptional regulator [Bacteroidaceae bacterium]|nr:GntR family transcriptional regulator [Bacteroidaceae bacterium]